LLDDDANPADLPAVEITDAPDVGFRGVVEGFYGTPWTHADRLSQFVFYGRHKMDTYVYGPKDDPFHSSPNWRKPYPDKDAARIRELVTSARANKVDFVWAIHPGKDIKWTPADYDAVKAKFESMYSLGVRSFAVFFDDIGGDGAKPEKQAELLNRLDREFVQMKPDVTPLVMCPTEYNKSWSDPKKGGYLDILGEKLAPSVRVMWTGDRVVADIDKGAMEYINTRLRRKAFVWWNFPVSDYVRNHLLMGPAYGNTADAAPLMSGFVANPMERAEASKVALYGVAGYAWNPASYDAESAWSAAMKEVLPGAPDASRTFCAHNSDLGANGHGYRRAESVVIAPVAKAFLESFRANRTDAAAISTLRAEFVRIVSAPAAIRAAANPRLLSEIGPWLDAFKELGEAGVATMDLVVAGDKQTAWAAYARASGAMHAMAEVSRQNNKNTHQPGVKTGSLVLEPLVFEVLKRAGEKMLSEVSGRTVATIRPITNFSNVEGIEKMADGDGRNYYYSQQIQKVGDWFGVDLGAEISVSKVTLLMGRKDGDHDIVHRGQLESTHDGKTWIPLGGPTTGESVGWSGRPVLARQVRYRVLTAGKLDGTKSDVWTAIREFRVNPESPAKVFTSVKNLTGTPVHVDGESVSLAPQLEVVHLNPGQYLGVELPDSVDVKKIEVDLSAAEPASWATVEVSSDGKKWDSLKVVATGTAFTGAIITNKGEYVSARFIRVRNAGKGSRDVKLATFKLTLAPGAGPVVTPFTDGNLATAAPLGAKQSVEIPGDARGVALLFASGAGKGVRVGVASSKDAAPEPIGVSSGDLAEFPLPVGRKWLIITPVSPDVKLHEVVWRVK
jgi:hyaluronoglucosaminidase